MMSGATKEKGPVVRAFFNAPKYQKRASTVSNVPLIDSHVNYQQFILCIEKRSSQVRAWIDRPKAARHALVPFLDGYELRTGVGEWFETFSVDDGAITCWCDSIVSADVPRFNLAPATLGLLSVGRKVCS